MLPVKSAVSSYPLFLRWSLGTLALLSFCLPTAAQQEEEYLNISFQVYIWRTSTSIENLVGTEPPATREPRQHDDSASEDPPMGDVTALYVAPKIKFFSDGHATVQSIQAAEGRLSRPQNYRGPNPLVFFREEVVDGETVRHPLGEVTVDESVQRVLLLFLPMPGGVSGYRILPLENSQDRVPRGEALIYNFTGGDLATKVDNDQFVLPAGNYRRISLRNIENFRLPLQFASRDEAGEWEVIHRQNSIVDPASSLLFLIHRAQGTGNLLRIITLEN